MSLKSKLPRNPAIAAAAVIRSLASGGWTSMKKRDLMYLVAKPPKWTSSNTTLSGRSMCHSRTTHASAMIPASSLHSPELSCSPPPSASSGPRARPALPLASGGSTGAGASHPDLSDVAGAAAARSSRGFATRLSSSSIGAASPAVDRVTRRDMVRGEEEPRSPLPSATPPKRTANEFARSLLTRLWCLEKWTSPGRGGAAARST